MADDFIGEGVDWGRGGTIERRQNQEQAQQNSFMDLLRKNPHRFMALRFFLDAVSKDGTENAEKLSERFATNMASGADLNAILTIKPNHKQFHQKIHSLLDLYPPGVPITDEEDEKHTKFAKAIKESAKRYGLLPEKLLERMEEALYSDVLHLSVEDEVKRDEKLLQRGSFQQSGLMMRDTYKAISITVMKAQLPPDELEGVDLKKEADMNLLKLGKLMREAGERGFTFLAKADAVTVITKEGAILKEDQNIGGKFLGLTIETPFVNIYLKSDSGETLKTRTSQLSELKLHDPKTGNNITLFNGEVQILARREMFTMQGETPFFMAVDLAVNKERYEQDQKVPRPEMRRGPELSYIH